MNIHDIYTPNQVSKVLGNLSRITLPFWTVCYCHVQQSMKWWVHKRLHELISIFVNYMVHIMYLCTFIYHDFSLFLKTNGVKSFINKDWEKSYQNSWGSYILVGKVNDLQRLKFIYAAFNLIRILNSWGSYILVRKVDDFDWTYNLGSDMKYILVVATNQDVLLFKLLTFFGVLLTETCY